MRSREERERERERERESERERERGGVDERNQPLPSLSHRSYDIFHITRCLLPSSLPITTTANAPPPSPIPHPLPPHPTPYTHTCITCDTATAGQKPDHQMEVKNTSMLIDQMTRLSHEALSWLVCSAPAIIFFVIDPPDLRYC